MKLKTNINLIYIILLLIFSCINICVYLLDFKFIPISYAAFTVIYSCVFIFQAVTAVIYKSVQTNISVICTRFIPLAVIIFAVTLAFSLKLDAYKSIYVDIFFISAAASAFTVFFANIKRKKIRILMAVLNALWLIPLLAIMVISLIFLAFLGDFGVQEITQELYSPDSTYYAWVLRTDEGAMGGDTYVYVRNIKRDKNILIGTLKSRDISIKYGNWSQVYSLEWEDNETLLVDGERFYVS